MDRNFGEVVTLETRHDANETVDKEQRYRQILAVLHAYGPLTAKECADIMARRGQIPTNERNFTAPRLTEMSVKGMVEPIGKKICEWTGKKVAVYSIRKEN